jgi:hypothetical protein
MDDRDRGGGGRSATPTDRKVRRRERTDRSIYGIVDLRPRARPTPSSHRSPTHTLAPCSHQDSDVAGARARSQRRRTFGTLRCPGTAHPPFLHCGENVATNPVVGGAHRGGDRSKAPPRRVWVFGFSSAADRALSVGRPVRRSLGHSNRLSHDSSRRVRWTGPPPDRS